MVYTLTVHLYANDHPESIPRIKAKLVEAARIYRKDKETLDWLVMQDVHDPRAFTIVERFENEGSQKYHLENPYWKTFDPYVVPLLDKPMDLRRHEELDTSKDVEIIDLTGSDDELDNIPQSRTADNSHLPRSIAPAFKYVPPLIPRVVSLVPPVKRQKIHGEMVPRNATIGSMPNTAIVIEDDEEEEGKATLSRQLNVEIQVSSILESPGNSLASRDRADRFGASNPRVSGRGKIQKPTRRGRAILINQEYHGKMVHALKNQVFVHIQSALASYENALGRPACTEIGTKIAGMLTEEPGFVDDLVGNNWKLSARFEQKVAARAQQYVIEHATEALKDLDDNIRNVCSTNGNTRIEDRGPTVEPKRESVAPKSLSPINELDTSSSQYGRYHLIKEDSSSALNDSDQSEQKSHKYSSSPNTSFSNDLDDEIAKFDTRNGKTRSKQASIVSNHRSRQLRQRRSVVYRFVAPRRKSIKNLNSSVTQKDLKTTVDAPLQRQSLETIHKIQTLSFAGLDAGIERPYIKADDRELIRRGLEAIRSKSTSEILSAKERQLLESTTVHVDLSLEEIDFLCRVLTSELGNKGPECDNSGHRIIYLMQGQAQNIHKLVCAIREALIEPSQDVGSRLLQYRDPASIQAILEDVSEGLVSLQNRILRIAPIQDSSSKSEGPSISSLLRQREVFGNSSIRLSRGQRSFNSTISVCFEDSLIHRSEWTDCCGDISTVTWINQDTFVCGAIAHSDFHNMQYNKPGNLLIGNTCIDTLRSVADHRIVRPVVSSSDNMENSLTSMRHTQDYWLYTSVVSTAHNNISGYTFTASFDETVKVWKVCERDTSMKLQGTWEHDGKVNFVVTSERHSLVATASDVSNNAIRVYHLDANDVSKSAYNTYTGDKAYEQAQELQRRDKWAYYPATIQWGRSDSVTHLLVVGYSPRSVTGNDLDIPDDKKNTGELCIWNARTGERVSLHAARAQNVFEVIWHPTQPVFLAATSPAGPCELETKTQVRMFAQNEVGAFLQIKALDCPAIDINELTIRPMGFVQCYVTASCTDGATYVWDTAQGDQAIHVLRHGEPLETQLHDIPRELSDSGVKFAAWGKSTARFYTGSSDGTVKAWDIQAPKGKTFVRNVVSVSGGISVGSFSKDFSKLVLGDASGKVYLLEVRHGQDLVNTQTRDDNAFPEDIHADLIQFSATGRRPRLIVPHPEPEPPCPAPGMTLGPELSGRQLARTFIEEGQLTLHPDRAIGPIQGPNYHETHLYRKECHQDGDENKPLLPVFQTKQREEIGKNQSKLNIPYLPRVTSSDQKSHEDNVALDLDMSGLSLRCREELKLEGVDLDFEEEYTFEMELMPPSKFFRRIKDHDRNGQRI
ncbi:hypothetical protein B7463_g3680, partial [Scytalidium lignicola]